MKAWMAVVLSAAVLLAAFHAGVKQGQDRSLFVSPPDVIAEEFGKQLAAHRFPGATELLSDSLRSRIGADSLERFTAAIERSCGRILHVHGESRGASSDSARAAAVMMTDRCDELSLPTKLAFDNEWRISELGVASSATK